MHGAATTRAERAACPSTGELELLWAGFADDIGLAFDNEADLKTGLDLLAQIFEEFDLHLSEGKTETMILNDDRDEEYPETLHTINGVDLKNVKVFKYLGSKIQNDQPSTGDTEIESRIELAKCKFESIKYILCNQKIHMWVRILFFNAFIRSRLTYACQTWTLTSRQSASLDSANAYLLRRMIRAGFKRHPNETDDIIMPYVYSNAQVYKITNTSELHHFVDKQRTKFAAHIIRQPNSRHTKQLMFNSNKYSKTGNRVGNLLEQVTKISNKPENQFITEARNREF